LLSVLELEGWVAWWTRRGIAATVTQLGKELGQLVKGLVFEVVIGFATRERSAMRLRLEEDGACASRLVPAQIAEIVETRPASKRFEAWVGEHGRKREEGLGRAAWRVWTRVGGAA